MLGLFCFTNRNPNLDKSDAASIQKMDAVENIPVLTEIGRAAESAWQLHILAPSSCAENRRHVEIGSNKFGAKSS
jgi:hypothetical protein